MKLRFVDVLVRSRVVLLYDGSICVMRWCKRAAASVLGVKIKTILLVVDFGDSSGRPEDEDVSLTLTLPLPLLSSELSSELSSSSEEPSEESLSSSDDEPSSDEKSPSDEEDGEETSF